ncbi:hypothetical protein HGRIS_012460 [Hohenbuehelia grisea]|uniref:Zn(2)-C6 fungal-type domain-containing protein n=1 Tax=Hohenbuehelia grisea TaxID=104357 RepID=A0ABR3ISF5_9AGAR
MHTLALLMFRVIQCKRLKLKCDRKQPCGSCSKRETVHRCIYSPAAAEKVDLHSLNNRLIHVETTLTQLTSGGCSTPFVSTYPPTSSLSNEHANPPSSLSQSTPLSSNATIQPMTAGPSGSGAAPQSVHGAAYNSAPTVPLSSRVRGDGSALSLHLHDLVDTYLADVFTPGAQPSLTENDKRLLQAVGLDIDASTTGQRGPTPNSRMLNHERRSVKTESHPISLQHDPDPDITINDSPDNFHYRSFPPLVPMFTPEPYMESEPATSHRGGHESWSLPPIDAYHVFNHPSSNHSTSQSDNNQFNFESTAPSGHAPAVGVTSTVLDYLSCDANLIRSALTAVRQFEDGKGLEEEWYALEQRSTQLLARQTITQGPAKRVGLESLTFFATLTSMLALGCELNRRSQVGALSPAMESPTSSPPFFHALSAQALSVADLQLQGAAPDLDYVQACLWQIKYLCLVARSRGPQRELVENSLFSLVGKTVNLARQLGLGHDVDDDTSDVPRLQENSRGRNMDDEIGGRPSTTKEGTRGKRKTKLKSNEKERRRRLWWEVLYYDVFLSDCMRHPPLIGSTYVPTPRSHTSGDGSATELDAAHEFYASRVHEPSSLLHERSAPYTTELPRCLADDNGVGGLGSFELQCRFSQLVKAIQSQTAHGSGHTIEAAGLYITELTEYLSALGVSVLERQSVESQAGQGDAGRNIHYILRKLQKCEIAIAVHRMVIKMHWPFVRNRPGAGRLSIPRHIMYPIYEAAHGIIHTARSYVATLGHHSEAHAALLRPNVFMFYDLGRIVFDAAVVCANLAIKQPDSMLAKQAKEDVDFAMSVLQSSCIQSLWGYAIENIPGASDGQASRLELSWQHAMGIVELLKTILDSGNRTDSNVAAREEHQSSGVLKRKHWQMNQGGASSLEVPDMVVEEDEARYCRQNHDVSQRMAKSTSTPEATANISHSTSSPVVAEAGRSPQASPRSQRPRDRRGSALLTREPLPPRPSAPAQPSALPNQQGEPARRRQESQSFDLKAARQQSAPTVRHQQSDEGACNEADDKRGKGKDKSKDRPPPRLSVRARLPAPKEGTTPFDPPSGRSSSSSQGSFSGTSESPGGMFSVIPRTIPGPLTVGVVGGNAPLVASPAEMTYSEPTSQLAHATQEQVAAQGAQSYRSRSSSINQLQHPQTQQMMHGSSLESPMEHEFGQHRRGSTVEFGPPPQPVQFAAAHNVYGRTPAPFGSLDGYDGRRGSVDQRQMNAYMSAGGQYANVSDSSHCMSASNSPFSFTNNPNALPSSHGQTESGLSSDSPSVYGTPGPPSSTSSSHGSQAWGQQSEMVPEDYDMNNVTPVFEKSAMYDVKPPMDSLRPPSEANTPSMQTVQSFQTQGHLPHGSVMGMNLAQQQQQHWVANNASHQVVEQQQNADYWQGEYYQPLV